MWTAFADSAGVAIANMTSRDPALRFILSADDNWFSHTDGIAELMTERSERIGVQRLEFDRVEGYQAGDVGWTAVELTVHHRNGEPVTFRQTSAFIVEDGVWRVIQLHTSRGVPAEETFGYEIAGVLAELVGSLTEEETQDIADTAGSRGLLTLVFTDVEDSTRLSHEHGESDWVRMIQGHFDEIERHVAEHGGTVVKTLGDGAMAAFPTASGAADAAIAIQASSGDSGIRVRVGIHTGEAVIVGADYAGIAVAKAARVASAADGGEILVSSATKELLGRFDYRFGPERSAELKGIPGTHRLIPLLG